MESVKKMLPRVGLALVVGTASSSVAWADGGPARPPAPAVPALDWQPCGDSFPGIECATAEVPLNYNRPRGRKITLALARVPATDQEDKIGSVFLNPGGPGGSGVNLVLNGFGDELSQLLLGRFDIVGFDPRGIAASTPIQCFDTNDELNAFFADAPVFPYEREQFRPFFDLYAGYARQCLARRQPILRNMSTADVARDMDLLRRAVGDKKLTYLGFSYGSFIGNVYANLFPNNIRALVIDGVLNPRLWANSLQILSDRTASQQVFDEFLRLCDEAGSNCGLSGPGGASARYEALVASIRATPFVFPSGFVYSYDFLIGDSVGSTYSPESWPLFADFFGDLASAILGDTQAAVRAQNTRAIIVQRFNDAVLSRETYNNGLDAFYGNLCADAQYPRTLAAFKAVSEFAERGSRQGPLWWWGNTACAKWPTNRNRYAGPWRANTSEPVLVVGNFFDGATDYAGAVASSRFLNDSVLLSYAGWGHTAFGRSQCVTDYVVQYLLDGSLPPEGTVCPANPNPFLPPTDVATGNQLRTADAPAAMPMIGLPSMRPGMPATAR